MIKAINEFFLSGFIKATYFERRKATYLYYIIMASVTFIFFTAIGQFFSNMGPVYLTANLVALAGALAALFFFKNKRINRAGHLLAGSILVMIAIEFIGVDLLSKDPAIRYRLYINFGSLLGVFFIILSFFREKKYVYLYAAIFEIMLFTHAMVIYHQISDIPKMGRFVIEHFLTVSSGMAIIAAICTWLLSYMEALFQQNLEYTERFKEQNEHLEKMVEDRTHALQNSNKNLREFAYLVSHDLKEPLRTISGFVTLIKRELDRQGMNDTEINEYINYVTAGTKQMELLISDILTYSKLNSIEQSFEEIDMKDIIALTKKSLAQSIYESEAEIELQNLLPVKGERTMLKQLFENLVSNAIKYRSSNRPLKVTIGCYRELDTARYFVKDNGIGIPEKYFETIFKAFRRLHSKADYEGTGVGLAICKKIVDIHGGDIWVESVEGAGSTFWFLLPLAQTEVPAINPVVHAD